jgi:hypothetical protein
MATIASVQMREPPPEYESEPLPCLFCCLVLAPSFSCALLGRGQRQQETISYRLGTLSYVRLLLIVFISLLLSSSLSPLKADWIRDFSSEVTYDDNFSRTDAAVNRRDEVIFDQQLHLGRYDEVWDKFLFTGTADVERRDFANFGEFASTAAGASVSLRYRFGLGATAPFIRLQASGGYTFFDHKVLAHPITPTQSEEIGQDGGWGRGQITIGKRFTDRLAVDAAYVYYHFEGPIRVFQRTSNSLLLTGSYDFTSTTRLVGSYEFADGEVISYNVPPLPGETGFPSPIVPLTNAILKGVDTFGVGRAPNGMQRFYNAYNLHARSHIFGVGISQSITRFFAVSLRYEHAKVSRESLEYPDNVIRASVHASF